MLVNKRTAALILSILTVMGSSACSAQTATETETETEDLTIYESEITETTFGLGSYVKGSYWLGSESDEFENVSYLCLVVELEDSVMKTGNDLFYSYSVSKDGGQIFMSEQVEMDSAVINCTFGTSTGDLLPGGTYSVTCFDMNGAVIAGATASVTETPIVAPDMSEDWEPYDDSEYLNSYTYEITDEEFEGLVNTDLSSWWDYSDTSVGLSAYASDSSVLGFSLVTDKWSDDSLYYAFYFTEDGTFSEENENLEPVFVNRVALIQYSDFASYDIDVKPEMLLPGYYCFIVSKDSSFENIVMEGSCLVVSETMEEVSEDA